MSASLLVASAHAGVPTISLSWRLIDNLPDNRFQAEFTLKNDGADPLAGNWAIYFNSASRLVPESVADGFRLSHVNGDFFVLRPDQRTEPIGPGEQRVIRYDGVPWAITSSDAPGGPYLILNDGADDQAPPIPLQLRIEPFSSAEHIRRGAGDAVPVVTAESRFLKNEPLKLLPAEQLSKVTPTPVAVMRLPGKVVIRPTTTIVYDESLASEAEYLAESLAAALGERPSTKRATADSAPQTDAIRLRNSKRPAIAAGAPSNDSDESYTVLVDPEHGIEIAGSSSAGVFYGVQTLRALLPLAAFRQPMDELEVGAVRIEDRPRFSYRGLHLDVARNFQSKETVKKLLELMAFYKLNHFHWHLTDDEGWRFEVAALPELTEVGGRRGHTLDDANCLMPSHGSGPFPDLATSAGSGFYTRDDMIEILRFAKSRHITVVPEIDFPGHARAAIKAMNARRIKLIASGNLAEANKYALIDPMDRSKYESVQMWNDNVVDVCREETYAFLEVVIGELVEIYRQAGVTLTEIHLGGDEVPAGVWSLSPACAKIDDEPESTLPRHEQLQCHFLARASEILARQSIRAACWEDCLLMRLGSQSPQNARSAFGRGEGPIAYVWNNVWGWGREDAAYRLANAGFDVVLCNATHLYFDLACEKDPRELGYYWAGFVDARAPFELIPLDIFKNAEHNGMGQPIAEESFAGRARLTEDGKRHILGIQGQLWGESLRNAGHLEYMAFPRLIALSERAWAKEPTWSHIEQPTARTQQIERDWNEFANRLGQRELPRLDYLHGGVQYRLSPPGAVVRNGFVFANVDVPGLQIHYTTDGAEPTEMDRVYSGPIPVETGVRLRTFNTRGRGGLSNLIPAAGAAR